MQAAQPVGLHSRPYRAEGGVRRNSKIVTKLAVIFCSERNDDFESNIDTTQSFQEFKEPRFSIRNLFLRRCISKLGQCSTRGAMRVGKISGAIINRSRYCLIDQGENFFCLIDRNNEWKWKSAANLLQELIE